MKRYVVEYTNAHNQALTKDIMEPDYQLQMGGHRISGRDGAYAEATRRQLDQFPGLGLTVHEIWTSGERLAMRFSEHGASRRHNGNRAAWGGIGLYRWNGRKLTSNMVEQDYFSRATQLASGVAYPVETPATAPWDTIAAAPDGEVEEVTRRWLGEGLLEATPGVLCDDAWHLGRELGLVDQEGIEINDLFSCGDVAAFHATQTGKLARQLGEVPADGTLVRLHMAGIVRIDHGAVAEGRVIRNRLDLIRSVNQRT
ncbi:MAG TPA: nuclear transport factor 2 family protein [Allosphingosinicella sp.]|jgi:hypothetical protein